ncbi:unnamed protein product [Prunus armeniaca]
MGSSSETGGGAWSMTEDVSLCEAWLQTLSSRWKIPNKELGKWRDALAKAMDNHRSGENLSSETAWKLRRHGQLTFQEVWAADIPRGMGYTSNQQHGNLMGSSDKWEQLGMALGAALGVEKHLEKPWTPQVQMFFGATGQGKKSFNHTLCWEVVQNCKRFQIIPTGPTVVLNEMPLHETPASDSPMDSPMSQDSPIEKEPRPIGRKAAKAMRIEMDMKQQEHDRAMEVEYAKEREYVRQEKIEKKDRETMAMDTTHMSPKTKQYWKLERRDVMRRWT